MRSFIDQHRDVHGVEPICKVLQIAPSGYRRHAARQRNPALNCARAQRDAKLVPHIERVWQANLQVYGADKVWRQLHREDVAVARCTVERLMRRQGLRGVMRGKVVRTTIGDPKAPWLPGAARMIRAVWKACSSRRIYAAAVPRSRRAMRVAPAGAAAAIPPDALGAAARIGLDRRHLLDARVLKDLVHRHAVAAAEDGHALRRAVHGHRRMDQRLVV